MIDPIGGKSERVTVSVRNTLARPLIAAYAKLVMPYLAGGYYYQVDGGSFGEVYDLSSSGPNERNYQVYTDVPALAVRRDGRWLAWVAMVDRGSGLMLVRDFRW